MDTSPRIMSTPMVISISIIFIVASILIWFFVTNPTFNLFGQSIANLNATTAADYKISPYAVIDPYGEIKVKCGEQECDRCTQKCVNNVCESSGFQACENGKCIPSTQQCTSSCDEEYGTGNWKACPKADISGTKCCPTSMKCSEAGGKGMCCGNGTKPDSSWGTPYCAESKSHCEQLYGTGAIACDAICCKSNEKCISTGLGPNRCVEKSACTNNQVQCAVYKNNPVCCNFGEVCIAMDSEGRKAACTATATSCTTGTLCQGVNGTRSQGFALCCPVGSQCMQNPLGMPSCI